MTSIAATFVKMNFLLSWSQWRKSIIFVTSPMVSIKTMMAIFALGSGRRVNFMFVALLKRQNWAKARYGLLPVCWVYLYGTNLPWPVSPRVLLTVPGTMYISLIWFIKQRN